MSRRTLGLIIFLIFITGVLVYIAVTPKTPTVSPIFKPSVPTSVPAQTSLNLSPSLLTVSSSSGSLSVAIDTKQNNITGVQLELSFEPKFFTKISLKEGAFFLNPVKLIDNVDYKNGRITYILAIPPSGEPQMGKGTLATIEFIASPQNIGNTQISLLPKTLVTAKGAATSVLKEASGATIIFKLAELPASPATSTAQ